METGKIIKALVIGAVLGFGGVGLFMLMYIVILADQTPEVRLFASFFAPIIAIALIVGGYYLMVAGKRKRH